MQLFILPGQLCDLNTYVNAERRNRFLGAKLKKENTQTVIDACLASDLETVTELSMFNFIWYVPNRRKDPDNVAFTSKFVFDGLVRAGLLPNDNMNYVGRISHEFHVDKENPRLELIIHPLD